MKERVYDYGLFRKPAQVVAPGEAAQLGLLVSAANQGFRGVIENLEYTMKAFDVSQSSANKYANKLGVAALEKCESRINDAISGKNLSLELDQQGALQNDSQSASSVSFGPK